MESNSKNYKFASTNHAAFLDKSAVDEDFHAMMDFLKTSILSYAMTAQPTIYREIVEEIWTSAICKEGEIKFTMKDISYTLSPSIISQALHLPVCKFDSLPTNSELIDMFKTIKYCGDPTALGKISRKYLRKEWSYFFDTLNKSFSGKCSDYVPISFYVQRLAFSLLYNRNIDIGSLLFNEISVKLGNKEHRSSVIYYARFFMIFANHLCKELSIVNKEYTVPVLVQSKIVFTFLITKNLNNEAELVLPQHMKVYASTYSTSSSWVSPVMEEVRENPTLPNQAVQSPTNTLSSTESVREAFSQNDVFIEESLQQATSANESAQSWVQLKPENDPSIPMFTDSSTISALISKLQHSFKASEFDAVTTILEHREVRLNRNLKDQQKQMETLAKMCGALQKENKKIVSEKLQMEAQVSKYQTECEDYKEKYTSAEEDLVRVKLDLKVLNDRENRARERSAKRLADFQKEMMEEIEKLRNENVKLRDDLEERTENNEELIRLKEEIVGLISDKSKAEELARAWEKEYQQCKPRVKKLQDIAMILRSDPMMAEIGEQILGANTVSSSKSLGTKVHSAVKSSNPELVKYQKQSKLSDCDESVHASRVADSTAAIPMISTNGSPDAVIEIEDSDDDSDGKMAMIGTASASKSGKDYGRSNEKNPASQLNRKRKMNSPTNIIKTEENSDSSDQGLTSSDMEKIVKKFKFEADMLSAFNKDDELCLNAVCALYRQEKSVKLALASIDATRVYSLAKFLIDGDPQGKLRRSVKELQQYDSKGIDECRRLARNHAKQLLQIYQKKEDPFFRPF